MDARLAGDTGIVRTDSSPPVQCLHHGDNHVHHVHVHRLELCVQPDFQQCTWQHAPTHNLSEKCGVSCVMCMQVMIAVDEAMRRLQIQDIERNAILDAFRYSDARSAAAQSSAQQQQQATATAQAPQTADHQQLEPAFQSSKPFTR